MTQIIGGRFSYGGFSNGDDLRIRGCVWKHGCKWLQFFISWVFQTFDNTVKGSRIFSLWV